MFEESHKDFSESSDSEELPNKYLLSYYMKNPGKSEVILFLFISYEPDGGPACYEQ